MKPLFSHIDTPLVFGHRGYSSLAPENTMEAFDLCASKGVPGVELDVHLCRSGELVIIHDHHLMRLAGVDAQVEDLTLGELKELDVGSHKDGKFAGARIPLLEELFVRHGEQFLYDIEMKVRGTRDTGIARKTWETIREAKMDAHCLVSSFNPFAVRFFNKVSNRSIPTAVIYCEDEEVPRILQHGWGRHLARATVLKPEHAQVDQRMLERYAHKKGYPVLVWTVDDLQLGKKLLDLGVSGIISNNPGQFLPQR